MSSLKNKYIAWLDREYMDLSHALDNSINPYTRIFMLAVSALIVLALIWANFAMLDEITRGDGRVVLSKDTQIVQNLEGGIVAEILVEAGKVVEKDDILLRIDDTRFSSNYLESDMERVSLVATVARLEAEMANKQMIIPSNLPVEEANIWENEKNLQQVRKNELNSSLDVVIQQRNQITQQKNDLTTTAKRLHENLELAKRELAITEPMLASGAVSEIDVLKMRREVNELSSRLESTETAIIKSLATLDENKSKYAEIQNKFKTAIQTELNEARSKLGMLEKALPALADRLQRTTVRSPVKGVVKRILVKTLGGVVQPGSDLVEIVPLGDKLQIEARIRPSDIAFLHPGQHAKIKFTAYDYAIYGGMDAQLEQISADTILDETSNESYYRVLLQTAQSDFVHNGQSLPIIPGMIVSVDIVTGRKSVLDYLLKPILKTKQQAMTER